LFFPYGITLLSAGHKYLEHELERNPTLKTEVYINPLLHSNKFSIPSSSMTVLRPKDDKKRERESIVVVTLAEDVLVSRFDSVYIC
jgi:hypothetical protein